MIFYNKTYMIHYDSMIIMIPLYLRWIIYLLLFFIMFRTVFFAVLAALLVYNFLSNSNNDQRSGIYKLIIGIVIIWWIWYLIMLLIWLVIWYRDKILDISFKILLWILWLAIYWWIILLFQYLKFRQRMKLWIIKKWTKFWGFNEEDWNKNLTKNEKEIEYKRVNKQWKVLLWSLISIPLLLIVSLLVILLWGILTK